MSKLPKQILNQAWKLVTSDNTIAVLKVVSTFITFAYAIEEIRTIGFNKNKKIGFHK